MEQDKAKATPEVMDIALFGTIKLYGLEPRTQGEVSEARRRAQWVLALGDNSLLELLDKEVNFDTLDHTVKLVHDAGKDAFIPFEGREVRVKGTLHTHGMPDDSAAFVHVTAVEIAGVKNVELVGMLDADSHWLIIQRASENAKHFGGEKVFVMPDDLGVLMNKPLESFKGKACVVTGDLRRMFGRPQETWSIRVREVREPQ